MGEPTGRQAMLSRSELELELASLALAIKRSVPMRRPHPQAAERSLRITVKCFLDASVRVLDRTRPEHRAIAIRRLSDMAASPELGIIGFDVWLASERGQVRTTSDRHVALASNDGESRSTA